MQQSHTTAPVAPSHTLTDRLKVIEALRSRMTRQRLDYKEVLYAENLVVVVTEAFVTLILRRVGAKHLIGIGTQTTTDNLVLA